MTNMQVHLMAAETETLEQLTNIQLHPMAAETRTTQTGPLKVRWRLMETWTETKKAPKMAWLLGIDSAV
jgi:hypothetical protein